MHQVQFRLAYGDFLVGRCFGDVEFSRKCRVEGAEADNQGRPGDNAFHVGGFARRTDVDDLRGVAQGVLPLNLGIGEREVQGPVGEVLDIEVAVGVRRNALDVPVGVLIGNLSLVYALSVLGVYDGTRECPFGVFAVGGIGNRAGCGQKHG